MTRRVGPMVPIAPDAYRVGSLAVTPDAQFVPRPKHPRQWRKHPPIDRVERVTLRVHVTVSHERGSPDNVRFRGNH